MKNGPNTKDPVTRKLMLFEKMFPAPESLNYASSAVCDSH